MTVRDAAARGFQRGADDYEAARPGYPPEVVALLVDALGLGPGRRVLDLAAGTGKLTRLLVPSGAEVVAVEPVAAMRSELAERVPGAEVLEGTAEALPLPDASVDA
ncbi:MAG: methyltransferase domain-containing protein, partial [Acidimicrobiales bacterium]|nr:methyltransferase domain-containing protein [Acidimicrobiales bacterium]